MSSSNYERTEVELDSGGSTCRAWFYTPSRTGTVPCIVMAHGFCSTREMALEPYADRFARAGFAVLLFDYRHFGDSDGLPRQLVSVSDQLEDYRSAIAHARGLPRVDPDRIGLWGTSFSGGHVVRVAAQDARIAAVCCQCPMVDGRASAAHAMRHGPRSAAKAGLHAVIDRIGESLGRAPHTIRIVARPGSAAAMSTPGSEGGYRSIAPDGFRNEVVARSLLPLASYRPGLEAHRVASPLLVQVCERDDLAPPDAAIEAAMRATRAELLRYPIGHFDIYRGDAVQEAVADQVDFFSRHLTGTETRQRTFDATGTPRASVAVVTGAARGLGRLTAERLARRGHRVLITDVDESVLRTADQMRSNVWAMVQDVRDPASHDRVAAEARSRGTVRVWVNNAGVLRTGAVWSQTPDEAKLQCDVNLLGVIYGAHTAVRTMAQSGGGHIINIASMSSLAPVPGLAVYAATKHAVLGLSTSLQGDLDQAGLPIRVTAFCPDTTETAMVHTVSGDESSSMLFAADRLLRGEDVAERVVRAVDRHRLLDLMPRRGGWIAMALHPWPGLSLRAMRLIERRAERNRRRHSRLDVGVTGRSAAAR